ncbi:MAG: SDR family oxidoreductase [Patescibacteria group bacterium]
MIENRTKTILVTGASGMLGFELCKVLKGEEFNIIGTYNSNPELLNPGIERLKLDISSSKSVEQVRNKYKNISAIIHCAAVTDVNYCELNRDECYRINVDGTKNIVMLAQRYDTPLLYVSTPMVFSGDTGDYREEDIPQALNYYGETKILAEQEVLNYKKGLIIRANPIGIRPKGAHPSFVQWFVRAAAENRSFTLFNDVVINPISAKTFSYLVIDFLRNFRPGIIHLGSFNVVNKAEVWGVIRNHFPHFSGEVTEISVDETSAGHIARRPKQMWLNVQKAIALGYEMPSWETEARQVLSKIIK